MSLLLREKVEGYFDQLSKKVYTFIFYNSDFNSDLEAVYVFPIISDGLENAIGELLDTVDSCLLHYAVIDCPCPLYPEEYKSYIDAKNRINKDYYSILDQDELSDGHGEKGGELDRFLQRHRKDYITLLSKGPVSNYYQVKVTKITDFEL